MPLTLEARRDFIEGFVPLSLHYAWRRQRDGTPLEEALTVRINLYRLTSLFDGKNHPARPKPGWRDSRWEEELRALEAIHDRWADEGGSERFERDGYDRLRPLLEARVEQDVGAWPRPEDRPYGFFTYDLHRPEDCPPRIALHLANPSVPTSPFADPRARAEELSRLVADARRLEPALQWVTCGSWLNSFAPFQDFFPPEWTAESTEGKLVGYHYGWWGQFIDRRGGYHRRNGDHLRQTGRFPYPHRNSRCRIEALAQHLAAEFGARQDPTEGP